MKKRFTLLPQFVSALDFLTDEELCSLFRNIVLSLKNQEVTDFASDKTRMVYSILEAYIKPLDKRSLTSAENGKKRKKKANCDLASNKKKANCDLASKGKKSYLAFSLLAKTENPPIINKYIKDEIINKGVNTQSDITTNVVNLPSYKEENKEKEETIFTNSSKEQERNLSPKNQNKELHFDWRALTNYWNEKMKNKSIKPISRMTERRKERLLARAREFGKEAIQQAIDNAAASNFLNGHNNKGWVANFDWLILPNNFPKVLENNYDNMQPIQDFKFDPNDPYRNGIVLQKGQVNYDEQKNVPVNENGWPII